MATIYNNTHEHIYTYKLFHMILYLGSLIEHFVKILFLRNLVLKKLMPKKLMFQKLCPSEEFCKLINLLPSTLSNIKTNTSCKI